MPLIIIAVNICILSFHCYQNVAPETIKNTCTERKLPHSWPDPFPGSRTGFQITINTAPIPFFFFWLRGPVRWSPMVRGWGPCSSFIPSVYKFTKYILNSFTFTCTVSTLQTLLHWIWNTKIQNIKHTQLRTRKKIIDDCHFDSMIKQNEWFFQNIKLTILMCWTRPSLVTVLLTPYKVRRHSALWCLHAVPATLKLSSSSSFFLATSWIGTCWCSITVEKSQQEICLRGYCTPGHFFNCLCIFLKNYNTLVTRKIC